jgi:4-hydroxymandelate oxidase
LKESFVIGFKSLQKRLAGRTLQKVLTLADMEVLAHRRMSPLADAYVSGAAGDELTMRWNAERWTKIRLNPELLKDVSNIDLQTNILGHSFDIPVLLAPVAINLLWHKDGEMAVIEGANRGRVTLVTSTYATEPVEKVCRSATQSVWFQLYTRPDRSFNQQLIQRAEQAGCKAIVVTVDTPAIGIRNREERAYFRMPSNFNLPNLDISADDHRRSPHYAFSLLPNPKLTWKEIEWLCSVAKIPVWLKGIINPEDALRAVGTGATGIIVSNHGARNLDTLPATADALPWIVEKVQGRLPLMVDGGIRRGTDILKALGMGAKAVLIGRPYLHGLAVAGANGVAHIIDILRTEFKSAMAQTGRSRIDEIDQSILWPTKWHSKGE